MINRTVHRENVYLHQMGWLLRCSKTFRRIEEAVISGEFGALRNIRYRRCSGIFDPQEHQEDYCKSDWMTVYKNEILNDLETLLLITGPLPLQSVSLDEYGLVQRARLETTFVYSLADGGNVSYTAEFKASRNRSPSRTLTVNFEKIIIQILFVSHYNPLPLEFYQKNISVNMPNHMTTRMMDRATGELTREGESFPVLSNAIYFNPGEWENRNLKFEGIFRFINNS
jgi:hypothetical protein